jgi:serine/threonine-protein kinase HipA
MMSDPFFRLHEGLPRQGPGSDAATREALARLLGARGAPLPPSATVLDLGAGPGRSALVLAEALGTRVIAVDRHRPFLDQAAGAARARGLPVETREGDMTSPPGVAPGTVDLLWAEGAVYVLGFRSGLARWRSLLVPGGLAAVSECSWLGDTRPAAAAAFWAEAYPAMGSVESNTAAARAAGYAVLDTLVLSRDAWWDEYYGPLAERMLALAPRADAALAAAIEATAREIGLYRRHGDAYGYVFYLLRREG